MTCPDRQSPVFPGRNHRLTLAQTAGEDVVALLTAEGVRLAPEFVRLLRARRRQLRAAWEKVLPYRVGRWARDG